jgi:hypothetical protein
MAGRRGFMEPIEAGALKLSFMAKPYRPYLC